MEIVDGIEAGVFPAEPGAANWFFGTFDNCAFCEFDALCPSDREAHKDAIAGAPQLVRFRALADGADGWDADAASDAASDAAGGSGAAGA